jgi:hypothetical protein
MKPENLLCMGPDLVKIAGSGSDLVKLAGVQVVQTSSK